MGMVYVDPRQKRLIVYAFAGFFPAIMIYLGLLFNLGVFSFGLGIFLSLVSVALLHIVTTNAMSRFELSGQPSIASFDSLGTINYYPLVVSSHDRIIKARIDNKDIETAYSQSSIFESIFHKNALPAWSDKTHFHVLIPKEDLRDHRLTVQGVPTVLFNRRGGWFWTKSALAGVEDGMVLENTLAYLVHSTRNLEAYVRQYSRRAIDLLWEKILTPQNGAIAIVFIILIVLFFLGGPLLEFAQEYMANLQGGVASATGALAPVEVSQPLG